MIKEKYARELQWAADNVKNHTVELVSGVSKYGTNEIWRCTNNGSSTYGFDLAISRFGIAMYGDVDTLVFSVGSQYGIDFLARDSVCSYMIGKLEPEYREKREIDEDSLRQMLTTAGLSLLINKYVAYVPDDDTGNDLLELPEWATYDNPAVTLDMVVEFMEQHENEQPHTKFEEFRESTGYLLDEVAPNGIGDAEYHMRENYGVLNLGPEWYENTYSKHSGTLIQRLEMLRLCALKIKEVKDAERT